MKWQWRTEESVPNAHVRLWHHDEWDGLQIIFVYLRTPRRRIWFGWMWPKIGRWWRYPGEWNEVLLERIPRGSWERV